MLTGNKRRWRAELYPARCCKAAVSQPQKRSVKMIGAFLLEKSDTADKQREDTAKEPFGKQDICELFRIAFFGKGGILLS